MKPPVRVALGWIIYVLLFWAINGLAGDMIIYIVSNPFVGSVVAAIAAAIALPFFFFWMRKIV